MSLTPHPGRRARANPIPTRTRRRSRGPIRTGIGWIASRSSRQPERDPGPRRAARPLARVAGRRGGLRSGGALVGSLVVSARLTTAGRTRLGDVLARGALIGRPAGQLLLLAGLA